MSDAEARVKATSERHVKADRPEAVVDIGAPGTPFGWLVRAAPGGPVLGWGPTQERAWYEAGQVVDDARCQADERDVLLDSIKDLRAQRDEALRVLREARPIVEWAAKLRADLAERPRDYFSEPGEQASLDKDAREAREALGRIDAVLGNVQGSLTGSMVMGREGG